MTKKIDHLVFTVFNLEDAINTIEKQLGVRPLFGGYHKTQGTKNALLNLGNQCYLELLAVDNENTAVSPPRWMGVDVLTENKITRWALKSDTLQQDSAVIKTYCPEMGMITGGSRKTNDGNLLEWKLTMSLSTPEVEIVPFMIDWKKKLNHPTTKLPEQCKLVNIYATHPIPDQFKLLFEELNINLKVHKAEKISIKAIIEGPNGSIEI